MFEPLYFPLLCTMKTAWRRKSVTVEETDMAKRRLRHWIVTSHYNRPYAWISGWQYSSFFFMFRWPCILVQL